MGGDIPEKGGGVLVGVVGGGPPGYHHHPPQAIIGDTFWDHFGVVFGTFGSFWAFLRSVFFCGGRFGVVLMFFESFDGFWRF